MKCIIGVVLLVLLMNTISFGQNYDLKKQMKERSKFSVGLLPAITVLDEGDLHRNYSNGYGFTYGSLLYLQLFTIDMTSLRDFYL